MCLGLAVWPNSLRCHLGNLQTVLKWLGLNPSSTPVVDQVVSVMWLPRSGSGT